MLIVCHKSNKYNCHLLTEGEPTEGLKKLTKAKTLSEHYKVPYIDEIDNEIHKAKKAIWLNEDAKMVEELHSFKNYIEVN